MVKNNTIEQKRRDAVLRLQISRKRKEALKKLTLKRQTASSSITPQNTNASNALNMINDLFWPVEAWPKDIQNWLKLPSLSGSQRFRFMTFTVGNGLEPSIAKEFMFKQWNWTLDQIKEINYDFSDQNLQRLEDRHYKYWDMQGRKLEYFEHYTGDYSAPVIKNNTISKWRIRKNDKYEITD